MEAKIFLIPQNLYHKFLYKTKEFCYIILRKRNTSAFLKKAGRGPERKRIMMYRVTLWSKFDNSDSLLSKIHFNLLSSLSCPDEMTKKSP